MSFVEYETAKEAALRLGVTPRAVQKWAVEGRFPGATRHGKSWMIPKNALPTENAKNEHSAPDSVPDVYSLSPFRMAMPFLNSTYPTGRAMEYINAMPDPDDRNIALAEYYFFSGRSDECAKVVSAYQDSHDPSLRFSANLLATFANLASGHTHITRFAMQNLQTQVSAGLHKTDCPPKLHAIGIFTATTASVLLHLPLPEIPPLKEYMKYLPEGLKLYACYILAHKAYLEKDYRSALTIADMGVAFSHEVFPVAYTYCHIIAAIALMNLKQKKEALDRLEKAWEIAEPDGLIEPFAEHHGLLQGLIEIFFKERNPELHKKIDSITYAFSAGWRKIHNPDTKHEVADNLTTLEFTIAMLYSRDWTADEIAEHLKLSRRTIYNRIGCVMNKLGISDRDELTQYMLA